MQLSKILDEATSADDLQARYRHFNDLLFSGELPTIQMRWAKLTKAGGVAKAGVTYASLTAQRLKQATLKPGSLSIEISNVYERSGENLDGILIHEMIHINFYVNGDFWENHGPKFREMASRFSKILGFTIPLTDDTKALPLAHNALKSLGVIVRSMNGELAYGFISANAAREQAEKIVEHYSRYSPIVAVYIVTTLAWTRKSHDKTISRTFGFKTPFFRLSQDLLDDLKKIEPIAQS